MKTRYFIAIVAVLPLLLYGRPTCACSTRFMGYSSSVKSDIRLLAELQTEHLTKHGRYASQLSALTSQAVDGSSVPYRVSKGVAVILERGDAIGWTARARHDSLDGECAAGVGPGAPADLSDNRYGFNLSCNLASREIDPIAVLTAVRLAGFFLVVGLTFWVRRAVLRGRRPPHAHWPLAVLGVFSLLGLFGSTADCGILATGAAVCWALIAGVLGLWHWRALRPRVLA